MMLDSTFEQIYSTGLGTEVFTQTVLSFLVTIFDSVLKCVQRTQVNFGPSCPSSFRADIIWHFIAAIFTMFVTRPESIYETTFQVFHIHMQGSMYDAVYQISTVLHHSRFEPQISFIHSIQDTDEIQSSLGPVT